jgi:hypothetical protein
MGLLVVLFLNNYPKLTFAQSGVDVMITIFGDFCHFSAKKLAFFSKDNVMIKFLRKVAANIFAKFFGD